MKKSRLIIILFFAAFLIYGLSVYRDYGISWDEGIERNSSLVTYGYLFPSVKELTTGTLNYEGLADFREYNDRYYGMAMQLPLVFAEHLTDFTMDYQQIYYMRHLYVFMLFWAASICFYFLCRRFTKSDLIPLIGVLLLILSPRILADSFYNIKDLVELSLYIIGAWAGIRFLDRMNWRNMLLFAFLGALCTNARIVGAIVIAACLAVGVCKACARRQWKHDMKFILAAGVGSILFYMILSPITWENPIQGIIGTLQKFSSYETYTNNVWFMGQSYGPDDLPWFYLPLWILATTPIVTLVLLAAGTGVQLVSATRLWKARKSLSDQAYDKLFLAMLIIIPVMYAVLRKPVLYNGWRHMYFLYPFLAFFSYSGFCYLWSRFKRVTGVFTGIGMLCVAAWMIYSHPYEYAYFNPMGKINSENNFEQDYWGVTQRDALQYICDQDDSEYIKVWMYAPDICRYLLDEEDQKRIIVTNPEESADYLVIPQIRPGVENSVGSMEMFEVYHEIKLEGRTLCTVYRKKYEAAFSVRLREDTESESYLYTIGNIQFTCSRENGRVKWIGTLDAPMTYHQIAVDSEAVFADMHLSISADGTDWIPLIGDTDIEMPEMRYICLEHEELKDQKQLQFDITIYRNISNSESIVEKQPVKNVKASSNTDQAPFATDQDMSTRWESKQEQKDGMSYEIELQQPYELSAVLLDTGASSWDYPRALEIWGSEEGTDWSRIQYTSNDNKLYLFSPVNMKYMRFTLGKAGENVESSWSIYEIELYRAVDTPVS